MRLAFYCWNKRVYVSFHGFSSLHLLYGLSVQFPSRQHAHAGVDNDRLDWMVIHGLWFTTLMFMIQASGQADWSCSTTHVLLRGLGCTINEMNTNIRRFQRLLLHMKQTGDIP